MNFYTFFKKAGLLLLCCWIAVCAFGQTAQTINPTGGASTSFNDGLKVVVNTNGALAVYRANLAQYCCGQVYPSGSTGGVNLSFRFSQEGTYNSSDRSLIACSTTQAEQSGNNWTTSISGYVISPISNQRFYVTMNFTYTHPNNYFFVDYYVRAPYASSYTTPETIHLYLSHDANIKGSDGSRGMMTQNASGHFVGDYRQSTDNSSTCSRYSSGISPSCHGFKAAGTFRSYYSAFYSGRDAKTSSNMLSNTLQTTSCIDDGVAVEFTVGPLSLGQTGVRRIMHGYGDTQGEFDQTPVTDPTVPSGSSSPVVVNFASPTSSETEGNASHTASSIQITVGGGQLAQNQICNFTVTNGTAVQNTDYSYVKGFTIPAGDYTTPQTFTLNNVTIIGNTTCQSNRTFDVSIDSDLCNDLIIVGSTNRTAVTIVDDDLPVVTQQANGGPYCPGTAIPATTWVFSGSTVPGTVYEWSATNATAIGLSTSSGTGNIPAFTTANATNAAIVSTVTVTPKQGTCSGTAKTFTITVNPSPALTQPSNQTLCAGENSTAVAFSGTNVDVATSSWAVTAGSGTGIGMSANGGTGNIPVFTAINTGSTSVSVTITVTPKSTAGCTGATKTFTITVNPSPVLTQPSNQTLCAGSNSTAVTFSGTNVNAATSSWAVTTGSGTGIGMSANSGTGNIPVFTAVNTGSTSVSVTITVTPKSIAGCTGATKTFTITVNPSPVLTQPSNQALCAGSNSTAVTFSGTNVDAATSTWAVTTGSGTGIGMSANSGTGNIPVFTAINAGSTSVSVTITVTPKSTAGCTGATKTFTITVNPLPVLTQPSNLTLCNGASVDLMTAVTNPSNYTLSFYTVSTGGTALSSSTVSPSPGTMTYYVESTSSNGCVSSTRTPVVITVKSIPTATLTGTTGVVVSEQVTYTAGAGSNYHWSVIGGTITSGGTTADATATVTWGAAGSGSISVDYTSNGCPTTTAVVNTTIVAQGTPTISIPVTNLCYNTTQTYSTTSGKYNYLWTVTGGTITSGQGTAIATVAWGSAGTGTIKVAYSEASSATAIVSPVTNVTINDKPTVGSISAPAGVCDGSTLTLTTPTVTSVPATSNQDWKLNSATYIPSTTVSLAQHGNPLYYEATNACGTTTSNTVNITVYALPTVTTTAQLICPATSIDLATTVANPSNYTLSYYTVSTGGTALSSSSVTPTTTTTYYVEAVNSNNCISSTRTPVTITLKTVTAITTQPVSPSVIGIGNPFTLNVTAVGENLTYQWYKDNTAISGATLASYSVASATTADYGNYSVVVSGDCGTAQTSEAVTVNILSPDATLKDLLVDGTTVPEFDPQLTEYTYVASCEIDLANIIGIPNHANATVVNPSNVSLKIGDNRYFITVTAENGFTTKTYILNIIRDCYVPRITKDLEDAIVCVGGTHTWSIEAEGYDLTYEWYCGFNRIIGANTNSITIKDAKLIDYERYYVIVRSNYNDFISSAYSKRVKLWVADYLPSHLKLAEYPNPATVGSTYHLQVDGYKDVTKYVWSYDKEGVSFSPEIGKETENETWATFGTLAVGTGTLKVTMDHPCGTRELTQTIEVQHPTGVEDITANIVTVYPNPTSGIVKVSNTESGQQIRILDVTGSLKGTFKTKEGTTIIDLTGYAKGTYMVQYNGKTYKVIKK